MHRRSRSQHHPKLLARYFAAILGLTAAATTPNAAKACWTEGETRFEEQMKVEDAWALVRVVGRRYTGLEKGAAPSTMRTWILAEPVDYNGASSGPALEFSYPGAPGRMLVSTAPRGFEKGGYYVVLLRMGSMGLEPVLGEPSVVRVASAAQQLTAWTPINVAEDRKFVPPGEVQAVDSGGLWEFVEYLAGLEAGKGATP